MAGAAVPAGAADLQIVVDRRGETIELYIATRADRFVSTFALPAEELTDAAGTVDFDALRLGTWDIGDVMFDRVVTTLDATPVDFEAMSLMVHPIADALLMSTPLEGIIAIGVCSVETPATQPTLDALQGYAGYIAYVDDSDGVLALQLPATGRGALDVSIADFEDQRLIDRYTLTVADGEGIVIPGTQPAQAVLAAIANPMMFVLGGLALGSAMVVRARKSPTG
ncbi:MAG: hypothetical protein AAF899_14330 [Pseudomonadota bacterium]